MIGIGYRKGFSKEFPQSDVLKPDFVEVAPENWIGIGGYWKQALNKVLDKYPLFCHGVSLSIGSPEGVDIAFVKKVKQFLDDTQAVLYSEHLSFSKVDNAHLYDLLPIPFTEVAIQSVVQNIQKVQDIIGKRLVIENVSYYTTLKSEMTELAFLQEIVARADCEILLDVNNVYVNAFNHAYNAKQFIAELPLHKVRYIHMAGHCKVAKKLIIDTHGQAISHSVYKLLRYTLKQMADDVPILLERDFNIPDLPELQAEINALRAIKSKNLHKKNNQVR